MGGRVCSGTAKYSVEVGGDVSRSGSSSSPYDGVVGCVAWVKAERRDDEYSAGGSS